MSPVDRPRGTNLGLHVRRAPARRAPESTLVFPPRRHPHPTVAHGLAHGLAGGLASPPGSCMTAGARPRGTWCGPGCLNASASLPVLAIIDGSAGLAAALREQWPSLAIQRGTAHKLRNLEAEATCGWRIRRNPTSFDLRVP